MGISNSVRGRLLMGAATGVLFFASAPAMAQDADDPVTVDQPGDEDDTARLGTVTVKGIKGSIQNSLNTKKNETSIVEAISAEDIGKLPDLSIADSLARLPGVTAQRVRGRSQQISIRGLGPDFSLALWNGREVVSAGNNRGVEFDQFPSELVAQGVVYKTPDARLAATGIAGAVDLRTVRPLDYTERKLNFSAKYSVNDNGQLNPDVDDDGYRFFGSYIDQNEAGTIGWSLAATVQSNPTQFFSRELKTNSGQTSIDPATGLVYPSDNPRTGVVSRDFERTSVAGALEFEPNSRWHTAIDAFYTDTEDSGIFRGVETPIASWSTADFVGTGGNSGFADAAAYEDVTTFLRTDTEGNTAEIWAFGLNSSYELTDRLTLIGDYSRSTLERNDIDYESYAGTGFAGAGPTDTLIFGFPNDGAYNIIHGLDYTDPGTVLLTDPGGWGQVGFIKQPKIDDELDQLRLEAEYDLDNSFISGLTGGVLLTSREKNFDSNESFLRAGDTWVNGSLTIPGNKIVGKTDTGDIGFDIIAYDPSSFLRDGTYNVEKATFDTEWRVEEEITTIYAMANINSALGDVPVRGNVGLQYVDTTQKSNGTLNFGANQFLQTVEYSYENWLPSLNLSFEVKPDTFIRAAAAQTVTRPRLDQMAANQQLSTNPQVCIDTDSDQLPDTVIAPVTPANTCFALGGGNPFLEPYKSTSFDLAFEKYFDATTAISIALFHKELEDWVVDNPSLIDGTQIIRSGGLGDFLDANPDVALTRLNGVDNFSDGSITGIEATLRMNLDNYLPEDLAGFGFNASYTYADASIDDASGSAIDIPGYSDTVWSGDVYYENHGFRARVSARHRSGFLSEVPLFDGSLTGAQAQDETIVDLQVGYEWEHGALEGFGVNFEIFNLTDEPFVTENQTVDSSVTFPSRHELYGTTYNITVSKSF
ncbi:TonB-dependent receptor [Henriciella pelagia]|uniref:TonB-dependent receptor n=2 Tax=Henriciella pelagia TaxID=1977912 RepID=A0ABQ1K000_9PROT|nr:TonB-dependent receptor [Henriciella pelagia]GGB80816.1 TonB-dependent receptor [Henriciella pelagia]